jgi:hypothetical protein
MKEILLVVSMAAAILWSTSSALAWSPKLEVDEHTWIQFGFLAQLQYETAEDAAGVENDEWSNELFVRRARFLANGSVHEKVKFFFDTDVPNAGKTGADNSLVWNDGLVDLQFLPQFKLAIGRLLPPFSVENQASASTLLGIDYNVNTIKLPTPNDRAVWRDDGIEAHGILGRDLIDYRVGLFRGERDKERNPDQDLRFTGMAMINLVDPQPGWYYNMNGLGSLNMLSFGAGYDRLANSAPGLSDGRAWSLFALLDQPLGVARVTAHAAYYDWRGDGWAGDFEGKTASVQVGYLMSGFFAPGQWQPVLRWQRQDPDSGASLDTVNIGLGYYLKGHNINFKIDYALNDRLVAGDKKDAFRFQTQLLF